MAMGSHYIRYIYIYAPYHSSRPKAYSKRMGHQGPSGVEHLSLSLIQKRSPHATPAWYLRGCSPHAGPSAHQATSFTIEDPQKKPPRPCDMNQRWGQTISDTTLQVAETMMPQVSSSLLFNTLLGLPGHHQLLLHLGLFSCLMHANRKPFGNNTPAQPGPCAPNPCSLLQGRQWCPHTSSEF